ncbi:M4 family metallopeptidase [Fulvivirga sp. 29W222]|uniref:M4 family metallopeptidase n=1 Tax=Fulvivirga marina TaxID=2494733 RepID=A0A937KC81_9BACT|nr:M4 family metallopeptidase [Fulvivirga marina]MBL6444978.1 M4 family metallopeptidase [Fulvivirga marina]
MLHNYRWRYVVSLFLIFSTCGVYAQKPGKDSPSKVKSAYRQVKFQENQMRRMSEVGQVFKEHLNTRTQDELRVKKAMTDKLGYEHTRFQQFYKGVKVEFGTYIVHSKEGVIHSMNGDYKKVEDINVSPSLSQETALTKAMRHIGASKYLWENRQEAKMINYEKPQGELVILNNKLAYKFDIYALKPISRDYVYVDANTGKVLFKNALIHHADAVGTASTRYSGSRSIHTDSYSGGYRLRDYSRGQGIETYDMNMGINYNSAADFADSDNNWTSGEWNNSAKDNAALDAHWGAEMTYDYFNTTFNRNSFDNAGAKIKSYVHFDLVEYGYPSNDNAFWDGSRMTYGDGTSLDPLTTIDIAAHEIGHAVCTYSADLVYSNESGAMNEGFSDIWAACVEYFAAPEKNTWVLGEDLGTTVRSLENPKAANQPDTYNGTNWYTGSADNGGVHTNSGVLNHWFYILSVGKSATNDKGDSYNVSGVGIEKAAEIAYRLETVYLSSNSDYADARQYGIQAAEDLYGADSPEAIATQNAWYAVGIGSEYAGPPSCATGNITLSLTFDNYPKETSWTLINSSGSTVASGGTYDSQPKGSTIIETFNLVAGDYTFTINDAYGDGICCSYGNGSYTLTDNGAGATIASGGSFGSSESVNICVEGGAVDTQAPTAPGSLAASNISVSGATLSWSASSDNVGVTEYDVYLGGTLQGTTVGTSYNLTGLLAATSYTASVRAKDAAGNISSASSVSFTTSEDTTPVEYCTTQGNNVNYEWIDLVSLGSISNSTAANGGYGDFTSMSTNVARGGSYTINFSAGFAGSSYTEYWKVWIDFNQDGDFVDSGEEVVSGSSSSSGSLSGTINVPSSASLGSTRMRVSMKYNAAPSSCGSFSYGEVEDYTVNITNSFAGVATLGGNGKAEKLGDESPMQYFVARPNPVKDIVEVAIAEHAEGYSLKMMTLNGMLVKEIEFAGANVRIDMTGLPSGVYIMSMKTPREVVNKKVIKE